MISEVLAVQPYARRLLIYIRYVPKLFGSVLWLRGAYNIPVDVEVVVSHLGWTQRRLRNPIWVVAYGNVVGEDGHVTVHIVYWREAYACFGFDA